VAEGRAQHQGPDVDGSTRLARSDRSGHRYRVGDVVRARVVGSEGVDLIADPALASVEEPELGGLAGLVGNDLSAVR
jgi:exosome complex RNA-binding protein Csl4